MNKKLLHLSPPLTSGFLFLIRPAPTSSTDRHQGRGWGWCGTPPRQTSAPHFLHILILFLPSILYPSLVDFPHDLQTMATLETETALSLLIIWPFWPCFFARKCFFIKFKPSTTTLSIWGRVKIIFPFLPLSFPPSIITLSPFRNFIKVNEFIPRRLCLARDGLTRPLPLLKKLSY